MSSPRVLAWFSCGAASAVAAKCAVEKYGDRCEVLYCDTLAFEHPDNRRFMADVSSWLGTPIKLLQSTEYADIMDVFLRTRWLVGAQGARCTTELKKVPRKEYQLPDDIQVFGFTSEEGHRIERFKKENFEVFGEFPLFEQGITKSECYARLRAAQIELPMMYRMGYRNNNCIGCVKGGMGYWNKIREDFPEDFARMAKVERELGATILSDRRGKRKVRLYLDELQPGRGRYEGEPDIECGILCEMPPK
jgi:3'-phosphoadenosine 5'-phosphosulfate sulfotransferase (PAPS reductase)/FAD synthetase